MEQMEIIWLALMAVLLIIEIMTLGLTTIWFAAGALFAFLTALLGLNQGIQIGVFVVSDYRPEAVLLWCSESDHGH